MREGLQSCHALSRHATSQNLHKFTNWKLSKPHTLGIFMESSFYAAAAAKSLQSCPTLSDPMDCSLPGSSVHGSFQAGVLEWGAIAFSTELPGNLIKRQILYRLSYEGSHFQSLNNQKDFCTIRR